jgi:hypothetical protein
VDKAGDLVPFRFNAIQAHYWEHRTERDIILKARQFGFSTLILAWLFHEAATTPNLRCVSIAHTGDAAQGLFRKVHEFYRHLPESIKARLCSNPAKPKYANTRQLHFDRMNSWLEIGSAESDDFGRSATIHRLHCSELAFWPRPESQAAGLLQSVPVTGQVIYESTANGAANYHHQLYEGAKRREGRIVAHFYPWFRCPEYRLPARDLVPTEEELALQAAYGLDREQLAFRRDQITLLRGLWPQEYPSNDVEAFLVSGRPVFDVAALNQRLQELQGEQPLSVEENGALEIYEEPEAYEPYVISADPSEGIEVVEGQRGDSGADYCSASVWRKSTGHQVAHLHGRWHPAVFAGLLDTLSARYNRALIAVERNNHGHAVLAVLMPQARNPYPEDVEIHGYPWIYRHTEYDERTKKQRGRPGFPMNVKTRPQVVSCLQEHIKSGCEWLHSKRTVSELLSFVWWPDGKPAAASGCFDDCVMDAGIGKFVLPMAQAARRPREAPIPGSLDFIREQERRRRAGRPLLRTRTDEHGREYVVDWKG